MADRPMPTGKITCRKHQRPMRLMVEGALKCSKGCYVVLDRKPPKEDV